ncbi:chemotaxis protein CheA [candidate division KSB1 bacterium]
MEDFPIIEQDDIQSDPFEGMSDEEIAELLEVFFEDISEKTETLSRLLIDLEEKPSDEQAVHSIFQIYHTLKGTTGTFGFYSIGDIFHRLENLIEDVRDRKLTVSSELIDLFLKTLDIFKRIVVKIKSRRSTETDEKEMTDLIEHFGYVGEVEKRPEVVDLTQKEIIERFKEEAEEYIKLKSRKIDTIISLSSELLLRKRFDSVLLAKLRELLQFIERRKSSLNEPTGRMREAFSESGSGLLHHDAVELDYIMLENKLQSLQGEIEFWSDNTGRLLDDLQYEILQARMVEMNEYFQQLKRTVRDLVRHQKKKVRLLFSGLNTEIDRIIMEELKDPMLHIVRNAVDHGVEEPEQRKTSGKPEEAVIRISAYPTGNEIKIEIRDDGRGIDINAIKKAALSKGLYSQSGIDTMTDQQAVNLIFKPGFSTSADVNRVSGRGVGLDVVKTNIEKIRGTVAVESEKGRGTKFVLKIPTTLSSFPAVLLNTGGYYFFMQIIAIERIIRIPVDFPQPAGKKLTVSICGEKIPFINLSELFGISNERAHQNGSYILIVRSGENRLAIETEECIDQYDIVLKPPPDLTANVTYVAGVSVLPDGSLAYVLEPSALHPGHTGSTSGAEETADLALDDLTAELPGISRTEYEHEVFSTDEKAAPVELLQIKTDKKSYGIPVQCIDQVCDLLNPGIIENLNTMYDSILIIKNDKISLIKRQELKNPLKLDRWRVKGSAVLVKAKKHRSVLIPDAMGAVELYDSAILSPVIKAGRWKRSIPDIVQLDR